MWLLVYGDREGRRVREHVYEFRKGGWWTIPPPRAGIAGAGTGAGEGARSAGTPSGTGARPFLTIRATDLLVSIISLKNPAHARCREVSLGLAWNIGARDAGLEARLRRHGVVSIAAATAAEEGAPASLRILAAQYAADLVFDGLDGCGGVGRSSAWAGAERVEIESAFISLVSTDTDKIFGGVGGNNIRREGDGDGDGDGNGWVGADEGDEGAAEQWRMVSTGAWGISRQAAADAAGSRRAVDAGAIPLLLSVLARAQLAIDASHAATVDLTNNTNAKGATVAERERAHHGANSMAMAVVKEAAEQAARALQNLSTTAVHQVVIAKAGVLPLVALCACMAMPRAAQVASAATLHNVSLNPANRTALYICELAVKHAAVAEMRGAGPGVQAQARASAFAAAAPRPSTAAAELVRRCQNCGRNGRRT